MNKINIKKEDNWSCRLCKNKGLYALTLTRKTMNGSNGVEVNLCKECLTELKDILTECFSKGE